MIALEDGGALILTTALYHDPAGKSINETGVKPSVEMANAEDDSSDLGENAPSPAPGSQPRPHDDPVLKKGIEILRGQGQAAAAAKAA